MEPKSTPSRYIPSDSNGNDSWGYGGTIPEHITSQRQPHQNGRKKSNIRLNDQVIPKPTDINIAEKMIKVPTLKEHPYSSHISRFAMFPSFHSPDDPDTGVRAASQPFPNHLVPNSASDSALLSKTVGGPFRHEILETSKKKAVRWSGEHGFLDLPKPLKGEGQVFYPTPPKTVLPNPKLRDWDLSLSERTSNMLKNLERSLWVTSYQMHYTGSGPANPLKIDDFKEKIISLTGINPSNAPLRERSCPVFVPAKPKQGSRRRQESRVGRNTCGPTAAVTLSTSPGLNQFTLQTTVKQPQEITALYNEAPDPNRIGHSQSDYSSSSTEAQHTELFQEISHKQQTQRKSSVHEGRSGENSRFYERLMRESESQSSQEANAAQNSNAERPLDMYSRPHSQEEVEVNREESPIELCVNDAPGCNGRFNVRKHEPSYSKWETGLLSKELLAQEDRERLHSTSNPCILPRPPVLPAIPPVDRAEVSLTNLQDSFSKTEAHRNFNNSVTRAAANLRDNVVSGKKHNFCGINSCYIHG
ncbi:uncharacterized protein C7orf31 [Mugil cephalus]|uniref:uncharacterized protein C7orf31 n=1 Tax=Mugil cephalus TaxID=48193 RepID=UPI001FB7CF1A|nr:uncharacterized protein C7orf31 [Mugil cephalus]